MQRQDSIGSQASAASGMSAVSAALSQAGDVAGEGFGSDTLDQTQALQTAVFGVLLTLFKERWEDSKRYAFGRIVLEHLQLLLLLLQPYFLWTFKYNFWLWKIANYSLIKILTIPAGYSTYSGVLYLMIVFIGLSLAACGYISWNFVKNGTIFRRWPVKTLRFCMMIFYQVFYVAVLNYLLSLANCNWLSEDPSLENINVDFPQQNCVQMPHVAQLTAAAIFAVLHIVIGGLFALADVSPNPVSQRFMATAHSEVEVKAWGFKTLIVLCINLLSGYWKLQAVPIMIFSFWMAYMYVRWQPYYFEWVNHIRTGLYTLTAFVSFIMVINVWQEQDAYQSGIDHAELLTIREARSSRLSVLATGVMPAAMAVGMFVSWLRLYWAKRLILPKFRALDLSNAAVTQDLKNVHKFVDEYEVEIVSRCARVWLDYEDRQLDPSAVRLAEVIIKAGLARLPQRAHMVIVYANFLANVQNNTAASNSQLQSAVKLEPNWCDKYVMFVRDQEHMAALQKSTTSGSESAVDLVGYVEFQRNYKQVLHMHKSALYAQRNFWKVVLHSNVTFTALVHAFKRIESARTRADRTYQTVLERYPTNVKVIRAYARFLEDVKNDPWAASRYYSEADKLEEQEGGEQNDKSNNMLDLTDPTDTSSMLQRVDEKSNAVCVCNASGTIHMANKVLLKMFGYRNAELEGKNVTLLMPQPFSGRHNTFMRNYQLSGKAKILDQVREVVALHKDHYMFPVTIMVTKVSGTGADAIFMAVIKPAVEDISAVKAYIMPGGAMLCVDARFTDWFGMSPSDCVGKQFNTLAEEPEALNRLLDQAMNAPDEDFQAGRVAAQKVMIAHKYADPQPMDITITMAGTSDSRLFVAVFRRHASSSSEHLMVTDRRGRIMYITSKLAAILGGTAQSLQDQEINKFMAQPFMQLHGKWIKDPSVKIPTYSCRAGAPVVFISQQRVPIPAMLEVIPREQGEESIHIVKVTVKNFVEALDNRRLSLKIDNLGNVLEASDTPQFVFGFKPAVIVGHNLNHCLDVFTGIPVQGGEHGLDMQHILADMVSKTLEHKDSSWRCGLHLPMKPEDIAAAKGNVIQANMLANQTRAALLTLEIEEQVDDHGIVTVLSMTAHLWRAEQLMGVVEVDKQGIIVKAGCCALHQPGPLFGVASSSLLRTKLNKWLNVPGTYEGLLIDQKKKGALKQKVTDVKIGPLRHAVGRHNDGDPVSITVQAVVREGVGPERLVVKLSMEKAKQGNPNFARRLLGLEHTQEAQAGSTTRKPSPSPGGDVGDAGEGAAAIGQKSLKPRGAVKFGEDTAGDADVNEGAASEDAATEDDDEAANEEGGKSRKDDQISDWVRQASGVTDETRGFDGAESMALTAFDGLPPPPPEEQERVGSGDGYLAPPETNLDPDMVGDQGSEGDGGDDQQDGSEAGGYRSDFKRGKRLRKLARMLDSKQAQKANNRFYKHTVLVILGLLVAHMACFIASVVLIDSQKQYIEEVVDAGSAVITLHRMCLDCRVLDALHKNLSQPGIFTPADVQHFESLFEDAIDTFQRDHERTYLGRSKLRRLANRQRYKLQDYWETPMWDTVTEKIDSDTPTFVNKSLGLWEIGNEVIAAAREVLANHDRMVQEGPLDGNRFWYFVMWNAPWVLYNGYKLTLHGLVDRVLAKFSQVGSAMVVLLVLEGCVVFFSASMYVFMLIKAMVGNRANLFSVFLVIPTGFLRALASKQVQLDEDADTDDDDDDVGDMRQEEQEQEGQKLVLNTGGNRGKSSMDGAAEDWFTANRAKRPKPFWNRMAHSLNPLTWFGSQKGKVDTGKKQLVRNGRDTALITTQFALWGCVIILVYAITIVQLERVKGPFQMLNMINFLVFRVTRGVVFALETCLSTTDAAKEVRKEQTAIRLSDFEHDYISFLYGFPALGPGAVRDDLSVDKPAVFQNKDLANLFFRNRDCLRDDQSGCYPPGHKFYDVTHNGIDAMAVRFMQETHLLLSDPYSKINISSPRLEYIWQIGRADLFDGMSAAEITFRAGVEKMFNHLRMAHIIIFIFSLVGAVVLWLGMVRPYLRQSSKEARQIAEMLSQLPPEMDVEGLLSQALMGALHEEPA